jgi:transposase InsO family protein
VPWNTTTPPSEQRADFLSLLTQHSCSFTEACQRFGISRTTGYKWHGRAAAPAPQPLVDRSRRPHSSPRRTPLEVEAEILRVHDTFGWGARKVHAHLRALPGLPCWRAVQSVLARHGRATRRGGPAARPPQRFERSMPNHLWQMDFKGPLGDTGPRRYLFTVLDDHSRYLLCLRLCADQTMPTAWAALWAVFAEAGLPEAILSDNGFGPRGPSVGGLSWLEARLLRLGVEPIHGRAYHPQTQGKVERLHRTLDEELLPRLSPERPLAELTGALEKWRCEVYNPLRPHEALGNETPGSRWYPSERPRPLRLPAVRQPAGAETRKVMQRGEVSWRGYELMVGSGLTGERVSVSEQRGEVVLGYGTRVLRRLRLDDLQLGRIN